MKEEDIRIGKIRGKALPEEWTKKEREAYLPRDLADTLARLYPKDYLKRISSIKLFLRKARYVSLEENLLYLYCEKPSKEGGFLYYVAKFRLERKILLEGFGRVEEVYLRKYHWSLISSSES